MTQDLVDAQNPILALSPYELRNIPAHLQQAGMFAELHWLLGYTLPNGRNAWFQTNFINNNTDKYIEQVDLAWRIASEDIDKHLPEAIDPEQIYLETYYALELASLNVVATDITPQLLKELISRGIWTFEQGYALALRNKKWISRTRLFGALLPWLREEKNAAAYQFLIDRLEDHWAGYETRMEISIYDDEESEENERDRLDVPHEYEKAALLQQIIASSGETLPPAIWKIVRDMRFPWCLAPTLSLLGAHEDKVEPALWKDLLEYSMELVQKIGRPSLRALSLAQLANCYRGEQRDKILHEAWDWMTKTLTGHEDEKRFQLTPRNGALELRPYIMEHDEVYIEPLLALTPHLTSNLLRRILEDAETFIFEAQDLLFSVFLPAIRRERSEADANSYLGRIHAPYYRLIGSLGLMAADAGLEEFHAKWEETDTLKPPDFKIWGQVMVAEKFPSFIPLEYLDLIATTTFDLKNQLFEDRVFRRIAVALQRFPEHERAAFISKWLGEERRLEEISSSRESRYIVPSALAAYLDQQQLLEEVNSIQTIKSNAALGSFKPIKPDGGETSIESKPGDWLAPAIGPILEVVQALAEESRQPLDEETIRDQIEAQLAASGKKRLYNDANVQTGIYIHSVVREKKMKLYNAVRFLCEHAPPGNLPALEQVIDDLPNVFEKARCRAIIGVRSTDPAQRQNAFKKALTGAWQIKRANEGVAIFRFLLQNGCTDSLLIHTEWVAGLRQRATDYRSIVIDYLDKTTLLIEKIIGADPRPGMLNIIKKANSEWGPAEKAIPPPVTAKGKGILEEEAGPSILLSRSEADTAAKVFGEFLLEKKNYESLKAFLVYLRQSSIEEGSEPGLGEEFAGLTWDLMQQLTTAGSFSEVIMLYDNTVPCLLGKAGSPAIKDWLLALFDSTQRAALARRDIDAFERMAADLERLIDLNPGDEDLTWSLSIVEAERRLLDLLVEAGLRFVLPDAYMLEPPAGYYGLPSVFVTGVEDGSVEAHYFIQTANNGSLPVFEEAFSETISAICAEGKPQMREFPGWGVRSEFKADRGGSAWFDVKKDMGIPFPGCMSLVLHAEGRANVCILFFHQAGARPHELIHQAFYSLRFIDPPATATSDAG